MKIVFAVALILLLLPGDSRPQPNVAPFMSAAKIQETAAKPGPRGGHSLIYDEGRRQVLLIDGYQPPRPERGEVWAWDGKVWKSLPGTGPSARFYGGVAYDSRRKRIVSYGGMGNNGIRDFKNDTWEWDGKRWEQMTDTNISPRFLHLLAYDPARGRTVLYGGVTHNDHHVTETAEWDGVKWRQIDAPGPGGRSHSAMVYDSRRKKIVLFGGTDGSESQNDTWTWDGKTWEKVSSEGPPGRVRHAMAYDSRADLILMYGGGVKRVEQSDMWQWDGKRWTEIRLTGPTPGTRSVHAMAYDAARGKTILYGGQQQGTGGAKILGDTWEWDGKIWTQAR